MEYVNLIIDNSSNHTDKLFTYGTNIPGLKPGDKVSVPFARGNKVRDAYVHSVIDTLDSEIKGLKYVIEKDQKLCLSPITIKLVDWMRERYYCRYIDALKCFLPTGKTAKKKEQSKPGQDNQDLEAVPEATGEQIRALEEIQPYIDKQKNRVFLIHGVTSSGKTEVYMRIISECTAKGRQAIMLVPEISLTTQTISRFTKRFGEDSIAVMHSRLSKGERFQQWMRVKQGQVKIVIGARSAVFAPMDNIGVIILDEEHETTYKSDMTPKYDTVEVAIELAKLHKAVVLLGSATPSLTSYYRAGIGEYRLIELLRRFNNAPLPAVRIVDMRDELKRGNKSIFSLELYHRMRKSLDERRQIILFLNRRGYSTFVSCRYCGYVMRCEECNISMTYHKNENRMVCHYCGRIKNVPLKCPECGSKYIKYFGTGTEKVEELTMEIFPEATVERLDLDTTRKKGSIDRILAGFGEGKTDILIGTQLVAKGLDYANVGLVGVISADITLNIPDFRSSERTFQLITQAAGRAGRGDNPGEVIIQTYTPDHYAIKAASQHDYTKFYNTEIILRNQTAYPPYSDLIQIVLSAEAENEAEKGAKQIRKLFLKNVGMEHSRFVLGPKSAPVNKVNGLYRFQLLIKCIPENLDVYQQAIHLIRRKVIAEKDKLWSLSIDINPYGFL